jgi:DNA-directed RNA polymerase sigma subunit (sigma70/sigma32)
VTFREDLASDRARRARAMYERYRQGLTLAEVGAEFGVTRERVRQAVR